MRAKSARPESRGTCGARRTQIRGPRGPDDRGWKRKTAATHLDTFAWIAGRNGRSLRRVLSFVFCFGAPIRISCPHSCATGFCDLESSAALSARLKWWPTSSPRPGRYFEWNSHGIWDLKTFLLLGGAATRPADQVQEGQRCRSRWAKPKTKTKHFFLLIIGYHVLFAHELITWSY